MSQKSGYSVGFNTQPPEGGWFVKLLKVSMAERFQHTAARRRLGRKSTAKRSRQLFQHTAARRRLGVADEVSDEVSEFQHTAARRRLVRR